MMAVRIPGISSTAQKIFTDLRCRAISTLNVPFHSAFVVTSMSELFSPFLVFFSLTTIASNHSHSNNNDQIHQDVSRTWGIAKRNMLTQLHCVRLSWHIYRTVCIFFPFRIRFVLLCVYLFSFYYGNVQCATRSRSSRALNDRCVERRRRLCANKLKKRNTLARARGSLCEHYLVSLNGN